MNNKIVVNHYSGDKLRRALMHFVTGKVFGAAIGIGWLLLLVRELPLADYGAYVAFTAYLNIFTAVSSFGLIAVAERYVPELRSSSSGRVLANFLTRLVTLRLVLLAIICIVIAVFSASVLHLLSIAGMARAFVIFQLVVFGEVLCRYIETIFDSLLQQKYSQITTLLRYGLRLIALIAYALFFESELDLFTWIMIEIVCTSLGGVMALMLMWRVVRTARDEEAAAETETRLDYPRYIRYSVPVYFSRIIALFSGIEMAKLVTTKMLGLEASALFGFCASLAVTLQRYLPTYLLMGMVRPLFITAVHSENPQKRLNFLFSLLVKLNMFVILPVLAVMIVLGDLAVDVLSSGKLIDGGLMMAFLLGFVISQALRIAYGMILISLEDGGGPLILVLTSAALFATSTLFVSSYGPLALIIGLIIADCASMAIARYRISIKSYYLSFPYFGFGRMIIAALLMMAFIITIKSSLAFYSEYSQFFVSVVAAVSMYVLFARALRPFTYEERYAINKLLPIPLFVW